MRYLKDRKITLWEAVHELDNEGSSHRTFQRKCTLWAHYRPVSVTSQTGAVAVHEIADAVFTVNKPSWFDDADTMLTDLWCVWHHRVYRVVRVEDVEGLSRGDVKLFMKQERNMSEATFEAKIRE